jgi:hypothetical protein
VSLSDDVTRSRPDDTPTTVMKTAAQVLAEAQRKARLTTGYSDLDRLIDGVRQGQFYVVHATDPAPLDRIVHQLLVHCVLPVAQGGFDGRALYVNVCNYYARKTLLDPDRLATVAKRTGVDPKWAFENLYAVAAFNEVQNVAAAEEAVRLLQVDPAIRLVVVHNLTRFLQTSTRFLRSLESLKGVITRLKRLVAERDVALVVTGSSYTATRRRVPKPLGGTLFRHVANVVVHLTATHGRFPQVQATLVQHPYQPTPQTVLLDTPRIVETLTGRSGLSFTQTLTRCIDRLRRSNGFQSRLANLQHKTALDRLIEAVQTEDGAMANARMLHVPDTLNLMVNVHNQRRLADLQTQIDALTQRLRALEQ